MTEIETLKQFRRQLVNVRRELAAKGVASERGLAEAALNFKAVQEQIEAVERAIADEEKTAQTALDGARKVETGSEIRARLDAERAR